MTGGINAWKKALLVWYWLRITLSSCRFRRSGSAVQPRQLDGILGDLRPMYAGVIKASVKQQKSLSKSPAAS